LMVFTVYCLYCNVSGLVVLLLNKFDLIWLFLTRLSLNLVMHVSEASTLSSYKGASWYHSRY